MRLRADLGEMLAYVEKLNELDTSNVAPTSQVGESGTPMRDDVVTNHPAPDQMLANAPRTRATFSRAENNRVALLMMTSELNRLTIAEARRNCARARSPR